MSSKSGIRALIGLITMVALATVSVIARAGGIAGTVTHPRGTENMVVFVTRAPGKFPPPIAHASMDQKKMRFTPFVLPIVMGTTVDFANHDSVAHNVFTPDGEAYNLGTWEPGGTKSHLFDTLGIYAQACSLHPEMEAYILVLQNPYFALVAANGSFTLPNMPDGNYEVQVWGKKVSSADKKKKFPLKLQGGTATLKITF